MASNRMSSLFNRNIAWKSFFRDLREFRYWPVTFATWIPAVIFFNSHVGDVVWINGPSMYPFLNSGFNEGLTKDVCWNSRWKPTSNLKRGMIISFQSPANPETFAVKRLVAMEGDIVYTRTPCPVPTVQVPVNHVWVEGDNRDTSKTLDSNTYGPIPLNLVQGKVTHVLWPPRSFGAIKWEEFRGRTRVIRGRKEDAPGWD